jgi:hypothetical protein
MDIYQQISFCFKAAPVCRLNLNTRNPQKINVPRSLLGNIELAAAIDPLFYRSIPSRIPPEIDD